MTPSASCALTARLLASPSMWNPSRRPLVRRLPFALVLLLAALLGSAACRGGPAIENVLLISIDTLRADRLGSYGHDANTSPTLDDLAAKGVRFSQVITQSPWTTPSHMSLMTSLPPSSHTVNQDFRQFLRHQRGKGKFRILPDRVLTLAELFQARGFRTLALTGGGTMEGALGFARGFDEYLTSARKLKPETWTQLVGWLSDPDPRPFFLFFHTFEVHAPYLHIEDARPLMSEEQADALQAFIDANPEMTEQQLKKYLEKEDLFRVEITSKLYDSGVRSMDRFLGRLFEELRERGLWDKTMVVVTSDHGEEFADHRPNKFYNVHCDTHYDEMVRVPLIFHVPGRWQDGAVIDDQVRLIDVAPTILELAGLPIPSQMRGFSLVPLMENGRWDRRLEAFTEAGCIGAEWKTLRSERYKYAAIFDPNLRDRTGISGEPKWQKLFDLQEDPKEKANLIKVQPELLARMRTRLYQYFQEEALPVSGGERSLEAGDELADELRALGYIN